MSINFSQSIVSFLDHCLATRVLSKHTVSAYKIDLQHAKNFFGAEALVREISKEDVINYVSYLRSVSKHSMSSVKRRYSTVKQLFQFLEEIGTIEQSPCYRLKLKLKLPLTLPKSVPRSLISAIISTAERNVEVNRSYDDLLLLVMIIILLLTGIRIGELIGIKIDDITLEDGSIMINGKGSRERKVYITTDRAIEMLNSFLVQREEVIGNSRHLFVSISGRKLTTDSARRRLQSLVTEAGIQSRITPHMLRHTAATFLIEAGVDIRVVQKLLGHSSIITTQIYTHVTDSSLRSIITTANALKW
ncbi:MAG: hypothetical protein EAZ99_19165 [Alphaproteobacteria bacterium]|nr:MAG: hypothetical protein EAZ99_19165 [Alphaproteobacteria bacterium]